MQSLYYDWLYMQTEFFQQYHYLHVTTNLSEITFSISFDKKGKFEIGRKFLRASQSRVGFLIKNFATADLNSVEKIPPDEHKLIMCTYT